MSEIISGTFRMHERVLAWIFVLSLLGWMLVSTTHVQVRHSDDIELPCTARNQNNKYRYIVWFRDQTAIIKRKSNEVTFFNNSSPASLGVRESLVLRNVQLFESGWYKCFLGADIGSRDVESFVSLNVSDHIPATTVPTSTCPFTPVEVSAAWTPLGFLILSVAKVIFCSVAVWVCKMQSGSSGGHRRENKPRYQQQTQHLKSSVC
ncbi:uncharacterized protein LOC143490982 [Brachyhypopomus gauderio]|uniref:uncharacterized protein LOC143490982 n=1 Tax=Brachyhypopomus gauderio TaxID=698409 RepID=UPI0040438A8B